MSDDQRILFLCDSKEAENPDRLTVAVVLRADELDKPEVIRARLWNAYETWLRHKDDPLPSAKRKDAA